jgi:hypothetical protein
MTNTGFPETHRQSSVGKYRPGSAKTTAFLLVPRKEIGGIVFYSHCDLILVHPLCRNHTENAS